MTFLKKYKIGLIIIISLVMFFTFKLFTSPRGHGGYAKILDISAKKVFEDVYLRKYLIRVKNEEKQDIAVSTVLLSFFAQSNKGTYDFTRYPVKVEGIPDPNLSTVLKPGESIDFTAVFPKLAEIEENTEIDKTSLHVEVKAAVVYDGKPSYIFVGGTPSELK